MRLSPILRSDVILSSPSYTWLWRVRLFRQCDVEFVVRLPLFMQPRLYAPYELPEKGRFYVVTKGVLINGGRILASGRYS